MTKSPVITKPRKASVLSNSTNKSKAKAIKPQRKEEAKNMDLEHHLNTIKELKETIMLMETKMRKYEEVISIKDNQIQEMKIVMQDAGLL